MGSSSLGIFHCYDSEQATFKKSCSGIDSGHFSLNSRRWDMNKNPVLGLFSVDPLAPSLPDLSLSLLRIHPTACNSSIPVFHEADLRKTLQETVMAMENHHLS